MITYLVIGFILAFWYMAATTPNTSLEIYLFLQFLWPLTPIVLVLLIWGSVNRMIERKNKIFGSER